MKYSIKALLVVLVLASCVGCSTKARETECPPCTCAPCPACPACPECPDPTCPECPECPEVEASEYVVEATPSEATVVKNLIEKLTDLGYEAEYENQGITGGPSIVFTASDGIKSTVGYYYYERGVQRLTIHTAFGTSRTPSAEYLSQINTRWNATKVSLYSNAIVFETIYPVAGEIDAEGLANYLDWYCERLIKFIRQDTTLYQYLSSGVPGA